MIASRNHPINCGAATSQFPRTNPKQTIAERSANLIIGTEYKELAASSSEAVTIGDINYNRVTSSLSGTNARAIVSYLPFKFRNIRSLQTSDPSVLSSSPNDAFVFEYQSTGSANITVELDNGEQMTQRVSAQTLIPTSQDNFVSFVTGSLGRHIFDQTTARSNNSTSPLPHYSLYSTYNTTTNTYVKSHTSWAASLDFTGMMVNKVGSPGVTRVTAITPHHAIGASHYGPEVGDVIYFCDQNNQTVARTVSARTDLGANTDCCIVRFSEALPATVAKYRTLPSTWQDYSPNNGTYPPDIASRCLNWPMVITSHYRWDAGWPAQRYGRFAYIAQIDAMLPIFSTNRVSFKPTNTFINYNGIESGIRGGDSGGPCFFIINGELVLVHCLFTSTGGPFHPSFLSQINAALDTLGPGGQTYQTVDLSAFTNFAS